MIETLGSLCRRAGHNFPPIAQRSESISSAVPGSGTYEALTFGAPSYTGRSVSPGSAMTYTAVWCCVNGISKAAASVDLLTYRSISPDGKIRQLAVDDYRYRLLREQPNEEMSSMQWRQFMLSSLLLWGNSYNYLEWDGRQRLKAIWPLRPDWVIILRNPVTKKLEYRYNPQYPFASPVPAGVFDPYQILHIPGLGYDGIVGYSPITMMRNAVALGQAYEEQGGRFIAGGGTQKVALVAPVGSKVSDPEAVRAEWNRRNGGLDKVGEVAILHGGLEPKTFGIAPKDAQFLEGRAFQLTEVARMFDYPLSMLYDAMSKPETYASAEQYDIRFVKYTIRPWCELIEGKIDLSVLGSNDKLTCEHDLEDLKRGDLKSQMDAYSTGVTGSILHPNEARSRLRLPPDPNPLADKLLGQMQLTELGEKPPEPAQPSTPPPQK
jgi:HK97 family phage portal protein